MANQSLRKSAQNTCAAADLESQRRAPLTAHPHLALHVSTNQPYEELHRALGDDHVDSEEVPVVPPGIFTRNHPDNGKPNLLQAEMILSRIESDKSRINGILRAMMDLLPKSRDNTLESLIWAAYKLHEDRTPLENLRKALCMPGAR